MTQEQWLDKAKENQAALGYLVSQYHPASRELQPRPMAITAPKAERVCAAVRKDIKKESWNIFSPANEFETAIKNNDAGKIYSLLQDAWFGVPESTECWQLIGFKEAVDLLDDPWDMDENE